MALHLVNYALETVVVVVEVVIAYWLKWCSIPVVNEDEVVATTSIVFDAEDALEIIVVADGGDGFVGNNSSVVVAVVILNEFDSDDISTCWWCWCLVGGS